jgi:DNA-binding MarR family transcriptional regulator
MHPYIFGIKRAFLSSTTFLRRSLRRHYGLTQARFDILYLVKKGYFHQLAIRRALGLTSSTISEMMRTLERLGLLWRRPNPDDRRGRLVYLTLDGDRRTTACIEQWIKHKAGLRMVRRIFGWKHHPDYAFECLETTKGMLFHTEGWFTPNVANACIYPEWHPDD